MLEHPLLDVTWSRYEPGERGPDLHVHHGHSDAFYVVEGEVRFPLGPEAEPLTAPAGSFVLAPPNVAHKFDNDGAGVARWLNLHAPSGGFIEYLRGRNDAFDQHDPPPDGGRPRADAIVHLAGAAERLEQDGPALHVRELAVPPEGLDGVAGEAEGFFVLHDGLEGAGPGEWISTTPGAPYRLLGLTNARVLHVRATS